MRPTESGTLDTRTPLAPSTLAVVPGRVQGTLLRMFANPRVLTKEESAELVTALREAIARQPGVSELHVMLGMALCVTLDAQTAMDELAEAVRLAPDNFIAHLKMGELWMRLRVMDKAEDHTRQASLLAENLAQSDLARRQATTIRTMKREGIERSGYRAPWLSVSGLKRLWTKSRHRELESGENEGLDTVGVQ
ncbi:MAG TPA: hypothetical protein VNJ12_07685 [Candidatus Dormibacteraeota bacterium]|nr:hypothetical protein [Candidatus Dormibacteraeota bacterium]